MSSLPSARVAGDAFYFVFNDDTPVTTSSYYAHAKSVVVFNEAGGYAAEVADILRICTSTSDFLVACVLCFSSHALHRFIIVHSMPNFPDLSLGAFAIPSSALIYGQSFMCLSLTPASIDALGANFQIYNPQIYSSSYSTTAASALPAALVCWIFVLGNSRNRISSILKC